MAFATFSTATLVTALLAMALTGAALGCKAPASSSPAAPLGPVMSAPPRVAASASASAAPASSTPAPPEASAAAVRPTPRAELGFLAVHDGFWDLIHVGGKDVLLNCEQMRVLDADLLRGHDLLPPAKHKPHTVACPILDAGESILGIEDAGFLVRTSPFPTRSLVHFPSGVRESHPSDAAYYYEKTQRVIGKVRYEAKGGQGSTTDTEVDAFDAASGELLWRAAGSLPVLSSGVLVVTTMDSLVELDPETGHVLWSYGIPSFPRAEWGVAPILLSANGVDVIGVRDGGAFGHPRVTLFQRGAPPSPVWTGKIHGTVTRHGRKPGPLEGINVTAGDASTTTDAKGHYELALSMRGTVRVQTDQMGAGASAETKDLKLDPAHGAYEVNLKVETFDQACR